MTTTDGRSRSLMFLRFPARLSHYGDHGRCCLVSSSRPSHRACGSPAHGLPTPFTASIRLFQPGLVRPGCDHDSRQADQPAPVRRLVGEHGQAAAPSAIVSFPNEERQTFGRVGTDRVETVAGMAGGELC
jgi:hypothetical protein